jgi:hypothetical protein
MIRAVPTSSFLWTSRRPAPNCNVADRLVCLATRLP